MGVSSFIGVTPGAGAKIATGPAYADGGNTIQDQKVIEGEPYLAAYVVPFINVSVATLNSHLLTIHAGASLNVYLRRFWLIQHNPGAGGGAGALVGQLTRLTSADSGGTGITPAPLDTSDAASGATSATLPSSKGTEGATLHPFELAILAAASAGAMGFIDLRFDGPRTKGLKIAAGTANGIAFKLLNANTSILVTGFVEFVEAPF
jgi:hypothetical protein